MPISHIPITCSSSVSLSRVLCHVARLYSGESSKQHVGSDTLHPRGTYPYHASPATCPCHTDLSHVPDTSLYVVSLPHVPATRPCHMPLPHAPVTCPCHIDLSSIPVTRPYHMSLPHRPATCPLSHVLCHMSSATRDGHVLHLR